MSTLTSLSTFFLALAAIFTLLTARRASAPAKKAHTRIALIFAAVGLFLLWRAKTQI